MVIKIETRRFFPRRKKPVGPDDVTPQSQKLWPAIKKLDSKVYYVK